MICPYLRSSSVNTWDLCQLQYILEYIMGMDNHAGTAATKGSMVHKMFELRGAAKLTEDLGRKEFVDDNFGTISVQQAKDFDQTIDIVYNYFTTKEHWNTFVDKDKKDVLKWAYKSITDYPQYDPYNIAKIISLEKYFDIEVKEDWAQYDMDINGEQYAGHLAIRGTIDSILDLGNNVYEIFDLKTGRHRKDFKTGQEKTLDYLEEKDKQLLFYLYAVKKYLYPDKDIILSLYFVNAGGIFSVAATDDMMVKAEQLIKKTFKEIINTLKPKVLDENRRCFQCKYCCSFSKEYKNTGISICEFFKNEIKTHGVDNTIAKHGDLRNVNQYTSGGGRDHVETK